MNQQPLYYHAVAWSRAKPPPPGWPRVLAEAVIDWTGSGHVWDYPQEMCDLLDQLKHIPEVSDSPGLLSCYAMVFRRVEPNAWGLPEAVKARWTSAWAGPAPRGSASQPLAPAPQAASPPQPRQGCLFPEETSQCPQ